jgi:hypothetical protein
LTEDIGLLMTPSGLERFRQRFVGRGYRPAFAVVALEKLIELKLASGTSAPHRLRDLADVQDLIVHLGLPLEPAHRLDRSVQDTYRDLWNKAHVGRPTDLEER